jgi:uncharacterized membrane protein
MPFDGSERFNDLLALHPLCSYILASREIMYFLLIIKSFYALLKFHFCPQLLMAKFASGYIASGNISSVIAELLTDAEMVRDGNSLRLQAFGERSAELYICFLFYVVRAKRAESVLAAVRTAGVRFL